MSHVHLADAYAHGTCVCVTMDIGTQAQRYTRTGLTASGATLPPEPSLGLGLALAPTPGIIFLASCTERGRGDGFHFSAKISMYGSVHQLAALSFTHRRAFVPTPTSTPTQDISEQPPSNHRRFNNAAITFGEGLRMLFTFPLILDHAFDHRKTFGLLLPDTPRKQRTPSSHHGEGTRALRLR